MFVGDSEAAVSGVAMGAHDHGLYVFAGKELPETCQLLSRRGFRVHSVALEALETGTPVVPDADVLILDVQPSELDNRVALVELRRAQLGRGGVVLWVALDCADALDERGLADECVAKAGDAREVAAHVALLLRTRQAESSAERLASEWQVTFDAIAEAVFVVTTYGETVRCNAAALRMLGRSREEVVGLHYADLWGDPSPLPAGLPDFGLLDAPFAAEIFVHDRAYRISAEPVGTDLAGSDIETVIVMTDITELKNYDNELRNYADVLEQRNERQTEFLQLLSHELRNPLAAITAAVDTLEAGPLDTPTSDNLGVIQRQTRSLERIIGDLLNVSRITAGELSLDRKISDVRETIHAALETVEHRLGPANLSVTVDLGDRPLLGSIDRTRLEQVLVNVLDNAIKYTPDGGSILVNARPCPTDTECMEVEILDTGLGIEKAKAAKVFEMFAHFDHHLPRAQGGLGVGLSLVQRIVEMHGGQVQAQSDGPNLGTRVTIRLPRIQSVHAETSEPDRESGERPIFGAAKPSETRQDTVLLVEDNEDLRMLTARGLRKAGYRVVEASNGPEGERLALAEHPSAVVMDIGLPDMDGYELVSRLREHEALEGTALIAVTGFGAPEAKARALRSGFDAHFVKPLRIRALVDKLSEYATPRSAHRA